MSGQPRLQLAMCHGAESNAARGLHHHGRAAEHLQNHLSGRVPVIGRQYRSFLAAYQAARRGERVLYLAPNAESAWQSWTETVPVLDGNDESARAEFLGSAFEAEIRHDDVTKTTIFPSGGSVKIKGVNHEGVTERRHIEVIDDVFARMGIPADRLNGDRTSWSGEALRAYYNWPD